MEVEIVFHIFHAQSGLHFGQDTWAAGWLQGNWIGRHVPRASEAPEPKPAEKPLAFRGGVQAMEWVPIGLAPGPREGPTTVPGPCEPHEDSWESQEAPTQILARQAPLPGTRACRKEVKRKSPTSFVIPFAHSNVSKPFGKTVFTQPHWNPDHVFPEQYTFPRQLTIQIQHSKKKKRI